MPVGGWSLFSPFARPAAPHQATAAATAPLGVELDDALALAGRCSGARGEAISPIFKSQTLQLDRLTIPTVIRLRVDLFVDLLAPGRMLRAFGGRQISPARGRRTKQDQES
jgi:hypothetical protein